MLSLFLNVKWSVSTLSTDLLSLQVPWNDSGGVGHDGRKFHPRHRRPHCHLLHAASDGLPVPPLETHVAALNKSVDNSTKQYFYILTTETTSGPILLTLRYNSEQISDRISRIRVLVMLSGCLVCIFEARTKQEKSWNLTSGWTKMGEIKLMQMWKLKFWHKKTTQKEIKHQLL